VIESIQNTTEISTCSVKSIAEGRLLWLAINDILNSDVLVKEVCGRSYSHQNGFMKILLVNSSFAKLRIHIWNHSKGKTDLIENIHDHRWPFASYVLTGEYTCTNYCKCLTGNEFYRYSYSPIGLHDKYSLNLESKEFLRIDSKLRRAVGTTTKSIPSEIHRVVPKKQTLTSTLVIQGGNQKETANIYSESTLPTTNNIPMDSLTPSELKRELKTLIKTISF